MEKLQLFLNIFFYSVETSKFLLHGFPALQILF